MSAGLIYIFFPLVAEKGDFLALDLGGTNFRVFHVQLKEGEKEVNRMVSQDCKIPQEIMLGPEEQVRNLSTPKLATYQEKVSAKSLKRSRISDMDTCWCIFEMSLLITPEGQFICFLTSYSCSSTLQPSWGNSSTLRACWDKIFLWALPSPFLAIRQRLARSLTHSCSNALFHDLSRHEFSAVDSES